MSRPKVPGVDALFQSTTKPAPEKANDERVTLYLDSAMLDELDAYRLELRRNGIKVDRGKLIRACITEALGNRDQVERALRDG